MADNNIDLFGWDTAYGISFTKANEAIKALKSTPVGFTLANKNAHGTEVANVDGKWGDWQLTTNGDGQNLTMKCPITAGTYTTITEAGTTFDLSGTWVEVEIKLKYLDQKNITYQDPTAKAGTGTQMNLQARTASSDPTDPVASITASSFNFAQAGDPEIAKAICESLFKSWFTANLDQFNHVFSIFVINETADQGAFQWLKPTALSYAVNSTGSLDTSVFGVMAMTESRPVTLNTHTVDPRMLTVANGHSAFSISAELFVKKWIMPGLLAMRLGSSESDYVLSNDGMFWENKDQIQWGTFTDNNNNPKPAYVDTGKFRVGLVGDLMKVEFTDLYWEIESGITAHVNYTEYYSISLSSGTDAKDKPYANVLTATQAGKPSLVVSTSMADWKRYENLGFEIGMSILGAVVGGLIGGAADAAASGVADAAEAGEEAALESGSEMVSMDLSDTLLDVMSDSSESMSSASEQGLSDASSDISDASEMEEAGASQESILSKFVSRVQSFGKNLWAAKWKLVGGIVGGAVGAGIGEIPSILDAISEKNFSDVPSLDNFAANCVGAVQWPNSSGFTLTSATLSGALILGGDLQENK
ncbi:MAG TPA: TULIP family P47-like protein [Symbiobacteriaceae bacterium]|nr:TULIP family P47-like protein [Symbiobacteriaceae bacterium]